MIDVVIEREGAERARHLLQKTVNKAHSAGTEPPDTAHTSYLNGTDHSALHFGLAIGARSRVAAGFEAIHRAFEV